MKYIKNTTHDYPRQATNLYVKAFLSGKGPEGQYFKAAEARAAKWAKYTIGSSLHEVRGNCQTAALVILHSTGHISSSDVRGIFWGAQSRRYYGPLKQAA